MRAHESDSDRQVDHENSSATEQCDRDEERASGREPAGWAGEDRGPRTCAQMHTHMRRDARPVEPAKPVEHALTRRDAGLDRHHREAWKDTAHVRGHGDPPGKQCACAGPRGLGDAARKPPEQHALGKHGGWGTQAPGVVTGVEGHSGRTDQALGGWGMTR